MNNLHFSTEAKQDLLDINRYITEELKNPIAAETRVKKILSSLRVLQYHAGAGAPLAAKVQMDTDYRYIVSGHYLSFYRTVGNDIHIDRVIYSGRDYMKILFTNHIRE